MIRLRVYGTPIPQGSVKAFAVRRAGVPTGRVAVTGDNPKTRSWRQAVIDEVIRLYPDGPYVADGLDAGPVAVSLEFILPRPKAHYGTGKHATRVRPGAPPVPYGKPDLDKLCRAVLDALTDAGMWRDDAQVVQLAARKTYNGPGEPLGVIIEVTSNGQ